MVPVLELRGGLGGPGLPTLSSGPLTYTKSLGIGGPSLGPPTSSKPYLA